MATSIVEMQKRLVQSYDVCRTKVAGSFQKFKRECILCRVGPNSPAIETIYGHKFESSKSSKLARSGGPISKEI